MDQNRRETILSAALQAIHEVGPGRVRMEQVARTAGVSVSVIYRYFRSKDELLSVALQRPFSSKDDMADTRREEIRATALQLFARKGFRATTMVEIGEALQISPGAIYRWFSSKEEILDAILAELLVCNPVPQRSDEKYGLLGGDLVDGLHRMARRVFTEFRAKKDLWRFILADGINNDVAATFIHKELFLRSADLLREHFDSYRATGDLRPINPDIASRAFLSMLLCYMVIRYLFSRDAAELFISDDAMAEGFVDLFLHGILRR